MVADLSEYLCPAAPRFLEPFRVTLAAGEQVRRISEAVYSVHCAQCGTGAFHVFLLGGEWKPGEVSETGIHLLCRGCGQSRTLFDATRNGYDGEFGHLDFLRCGQDVQQLSLLKSDAEVSVRLTYNIEMDELVEHAGETGKSPQDFFDWFAIAVRTPGGAEWEDLWDYECA